MSKFVPVTPKGQEKTYWVNLDTVNHISELSAGSDIVFSDGEHDYLFVKESPEEILKLGGL